MESVECLVVLFRLPDSPDNEKGLSWLGRGGWWPCRVVCLALDLPGVDDCVLSVAPEAAAARAAVGRLASAPARARGCLVCGCCLPKVALTHPGQPHHP